MPNSMTFRKFRSEHLLTPDIDFRYVLDLAELCDANVSDCVYPWPENNLHPELSDTYTASLGFSLERMYAETEEGQQGIEFTRSASQTYTMSLKDAVLISQNHVVWTSSGKPVIMRRADQKRLDYDYSQAEDIHNILLPASKCKRLNGNFYLLSDRWTGHNLYHWTYDALTRLEIYFQLRTYLPDLKLLCLGNHNLSFHTEWLELLGLKDEIVTVSNSNDYSIEKLLITPRIGLSSPINMGLHLNRLLCRSGLELPEELVGRKKLFINRKAGHVRSLVNSNEITSILISHGFLEILLEEFNIAEKLVLAQSCMSLVALAGSGMFTLSFMRKGSSVLEITHDKARCSAHLIHGLCMGHKYGFCIGQHIEPENIYLDPQLLEACLKLMP
jgi:capsular polysaccharide biosynthesis protein